MARACNNVKQRIYALEARMANMTEAIRELDVKIEEMKRLMVALQIGQITCHHIPTTSSNCTAYLQVCNSCYRKADQ